MPIIYFAVAQSFCPIVLQFCIEHASDIAMLCAKLQNDWTDGMDVMDKRDFVRFEVKMSI